MNLEIIAAKMGELQMDSIEEETNAINERIDSFYDAFENEVSAKAIC